MLNLSPLELAKLISGSSVEKNVFSQLGSEVFDWLSEGSEFNLDSGQYLDLASESPGVDPKYLLLTGCVSIEVLDKDDKQLTYPIVSSAIIDRNRYGGQLVKPGVLGKIKYKAICKTKFWRVAQKRNVMDLLDHKIAHFLYIRKSIDFNRIVNILSLLQLTRADHKLAKMLGYLALNVGIRKDDHIQVPVTQVTLAQLCGMKRVNAHSILSNWQNMGTISTGYKHIKIFDEQTLINLSHTPNPIHPNQLPTLEERLNTELESSKLRKH